MDQTKETTTKKIKDSFKGKLCHTSPVMNSSSREKKITIYLSSVKSEPSEKAAPSDMSANIDIAVGQVAKSLASQHVFGTSVGKL